jgi:hypothetical protein
MELLNECCFDVVKETIHQERQINGDVDSFWPIEVTFILNEIICSELTLIIQEIAYENIENLMYFRISNEIFFNLISEMIRDEKIVRNFNSRLKL